MSDRNSFEGSEDETAPLDREQADSVPVDDGGEQVATPEGSKPKRKTWLAVGCAAAAVVVVVGGGTIWWSTTRDKDEKPTSFDLGRIDSVVSKLPVGTQVIKGPKKTFSADDVRGLNAGNDSIKARPSACQDTKKVNTDRLIGATAQTVSAFDKGVRYIVTAEVIPSKNGKRTRPDGAACATVSYEFPDGGASIATTPRDKPEIANAEVEATRTVARTGQNETIDSYTFVAWVDDFHAVVVQAASDPTYKPQASPIDPTLAKQLLVEGVKLVTA
ncbi:DUF5642 domain-containing protein [Tsukamurella strandjordii]|uniref:DUF5642 family protein n=1 Tax=Tsukamurella TaxID=2060 RepID=UPI001C7D494E|nr:DUF5642 family protein [Tsukamurella sp. TY48]GIZ97544.1 hypothetical protein TTY48_21560 [Tsukamurella sp. TY48]